MSAGMSHEAGSSARMTKRLRSTVETDVKLEDTEPRRVLGVFTEFAEGHGLDAQMVQRFELALDEVLTNVVSYAFPEGAEDPKIGVTVELDDGWLRVRVQDNGPAFDPLHDAQEPDLSLDADHRPIGGLGIFLAKTFVHTLTYERTDGCNRLTLSQPIGASPENSNP